MMLFHNIDIYYFMADGIAIWEILFKYQYLLYFRLMLLPFGFSFIGRCYNQWLVADVIPLRLMLLPIVYWFNDMADVIANCVWQMLLPLCFYIVLADVIANCVWQMLLPLCFYIVLADVIANCVWQMLLPLRLMLLPTIIIFGWCYCQNSGICYEHYIKCVGWWYCQVADGMATVGWRMVSGWCYYHWADVMALGQCLF